MSDVGELRAALKRCHALLETASNGWEINDGNEKWHEAVEAELLPCDVAGSCPPAAKPAEVCASCGDQGVVCVGNNLEGQEYDPCPDCCPPVPVAPSAAGEREAVYVAAKPDEWTREGLAEAISDRALQLGYLMHEGNALELAKVALSRPLPSGAAANPIRVCCCGECGPLEPEQPWGSVDELADAIRTATGFIEPDEWPEAAATVALSRPLPKPDEAYHVTINGQYSSASHCVTTSHGEPLVAFETGAGGLAPLDGKAVEVTIIERMG